MKVGILEADIVDAKVRGKYGSYADMFCRLLLTIDASLTFEAFKVYEGEYPQDIHQCSAYIITGSKFSAYDNEGWIKKLSNFIVELNKHKIKLIGICFGHQIIARALGGRIEKSQKGWGVGNNLTQIKNKNPGMNALIDKACHSFYLIYTHQDQVIGLPVNAIKVAGNDFCENAGFQIADHILTFQGHPEFSPEYLVYLMDKRRDLIGDEKYSKAMESLKKNTDSLKIAQWMIGFLK